MLQTEQIGFVNSFEKHGLSRIALEEMLAKKQQQVSKIRHSKNWYTSTPHKTRGNIKACNKQPAVKMANLHVFDAL